MCGWGTDHVLKCFLTTIGLFDMARARETAFEIPLRDNLLCGPIPIFETPAWLTLTDIPMHFGRPGTGYSLVVSPPLLYRDKNSFE